MENEDAIIEEEVNLFSDYKAELTGRPHPSPIQEGTALSWIEPAPQEYKFALEKKYTEPEGDNLALISAPQLQAIKYAILAHRVILPCGSRQGFLLGDGTGMGKSRTMAGLILEGCKSGSCHRTVWISVNSMLAASVKDEVNKLMPNAQFRTLRDACSTNDRVRDKIIMYCTYKDLTKADLYDGLTRWMREGYDGLIIFDEAHLAKSVDRSNVGAKVLQLQHDYPLAKVIYSTATSAYEPRHLEYMERLPLWGAGCMFQSKEDFRDQMEQRPATAMEMVSMQMKASGLFLSRQLSFAGLEYDPKEAPETVEQKIVYDRATQLVKLIYEYLQEFSMTRSSSAQFHGSCLRFFINLITSFKMATVAKITRNELDAGNSVVIGLQHTGDSGFRRFLKHNRRGYPYSTAEYALRDMLKAVDIEVGQPHVYLKDGRIFKLDYTKKLNVSETKNESDKIGNSSGITEETDTEYSSSQSSSVSGSELGSESSSESDCESGSETGSESDNESLIESSSESSDSGDEDEHPSKRSKTDYIKRFTRYMVGYGWKYPAKKWACSEFVINESADEKSDCEDENECDYNGDISEEDYESHPFINGEAEESDEEVTSNRELRWQAKILRFFHELVPYLPISPLDELCDLLSDKNVAELTSRRWAYIRNKDNDARWNVRKRDVGQQNKLEDVKRFMNGKCRVAIISDASSVGISLHADPTMRNQQKRVQITVELPWAADKFTQQTGRTHRSGQVKTPKFIIVRSWIPAEIRSLSIVAKRLAQLGAICNAQSRGNIMSHQFADMDVCNRRGMTMIQNAMKPLSEEFLAMPKVPKLGRRSVWFVTTFFNRLLMQSIDLQKRFMVLLEKEIQNFKRLGVGNHGIGEYPSRKTSCTISRLDETQYKILMPNGFHANLSLHTFLIDRTQQWPAILEDNWKFYRNYNGIIQDVSIFVESKPNEKIPTLTDFFFMVPNRQELVRPFRPLNFMRKNIDATYAKEIWESRLQAMSKTYGCIHKVHRRTCDSGCFERWGKRLFYVLTGDTLCLWEELDEILKRILMVRTSFVEEGSTQHVVGVLVKEEHIEVVKQKLKHLMEGVQSEKPNDERSVNAFIM